MTLPYFKVNICPFPLPHFASIFFAYLWSFRWPKYIVILPKYLSLPNNVWRLIVFAPFLINIIILLSFFPCTMNLSTADLRNYWTEFHETWWSYRYMFLVGPKVFSFVVKGVNVLFWGVQMGWGLLYNDMGKLKFRTLMLITSKWIMIETYNLT